MLAEGGEGRVFEVVRTGSSAPEDPAAVVYKQLRHPRPLTELNLLCAVPTLMAERDEGACRRAISSSAWPSAAVVGPDDTTVALGALMPRAPAQFWLRHRDGLKRLATLSYLAGDPDRMTVAYGVAVPPPWCTRSPACWTRGRAGLGPWSCTVTSRRRTSCGPCSRRLRSMCSTATAPLSEVSPLRPTCRGRPPQTGRTRPCRPASRPGNRPTAMYWAWLSYGWWERPTFPCRGANERTPA